MLNISDPDFNTLLIQFASIGGKVGVNIFFIISGYFMSRFTVRWEKLVQLAFQILSINLIVLIILSLQGVRYSALDLLSVIPFLAGAKTSFITTYVMLYALSGIINKSLALLSRKEMTLLLAVLIFYYTVMPMLLIAGDTWNYLGWGFTMYVTGTYIRRFDLKQHKLPYGLFAMFFIGLTWMAIYLSDINSALLSRFSYEWIFFVFDANKPNMFLIALCVFMFFLRLKIRYHKWINAIGGSVCFGVLIWHFGGSPTLKWLWCDTLDNAGYFSSPFLWLHCICSVVAVYIICTLLELIRQRLIQRPFDAWLSHLTHKRKIIQKVAN